MFARTSFWTACCLLLLPDLGYGYPNGTPHYVTDLAPACASCHAARKAEDMPSMPRAFAQAEVAEKKHYGLVRKAFPPSPYLELTEAQRERVIAEAKAIDRNASITLEAPASARPGEEITVRVKARGGNGPAIGIMLVDRPSRYQARPVSASGWTVVGEPVIIGQDGRRQTTWLDSRMKGLPRNLSFILVTDQQFDLAKERFPAGDITFTLRAPSAKGTYRLTAVFLYGTENAETAGVFQRPSGRILFSRVSKVRVE